MSEQIARQFHDTYERLAPQFGYETREDTRAFDPQSQNGRLMIAVCGEVIGELECERDEARKDLDDEIKYHHRTHGECVMAQCELMDVKRERDEAREALQSVMDWNPKPEYWERPDNVARFEADMAKARKILEETE